ncbi:MAG: bL9 family ribosomal protein [Pirellulaceae bacterium]
MVAAKTRVRRQAFKRLPKRANGGIELLLIQNVDSVGKQGEVVEVRAGHANNFCSPRDWPSLPPSITSGWSRSTRPS